MLKLNPVEVTYEFPFPVSYILYKIGKLNENTLLLIEENGYFLEAPDLLAEQIDKLIDKNISEINILILRHEERKIFNLVVERKNNNYYPNWEKSDILLKIPQEIMPIFNTIIN